MNGNANNVQKILNENPEVRPFPAAVTQLLAACQDPNSNAMTFERIVECDAGLAARLMRMANSPIYGLGTKIHSVSHATTVLGVRQLKNLALSVAGANMFSSGKTAARQREELWRHSLGCATIARLLAKTTKSVAPDDAFLAGIFHDVGKLLLFDVAPAEYIDLIENCEPQQLSLEEQRLFGVNHEQIGLRSAISWGLSEDLQIAIGFHHHPDEATAHKEFAMIVYVANNLAKSWGIGTDEPRECDVTFESLNANEASLADVREQARRAYDEATQTTVA
jgi:HD-like signal output (HDOD) protein